MYYMKYVSTCYINAMITCYVIYMLSVIVLKYHASYKRSGRCQDVELRRLSLVLSINIVLLFIESSSKERSQVLYGDSSQQLETELK